MMIFVCDCIPRHAFFSLLLTTPTMLYLRSLAIFSRKGTPIGAEEKKTTLYCMGSCLILTAPVQELILSSM